METAVYNVNGSWVCPPGVTEAVVEAIQAGSAGDGGTGLGPGGGGGAEGTYARRKITGLIPGRTYNIVVGAQTTTTPYSTGAVGANGGPTIFYDVDGTTELCAARGGTGASARIGGTGATTGSVGDSLQAGASGTSAADGIQTNGGQGGGPTAITGSPTGLARGTGGLGGTDSPVTGGDGTAPGAGGGGGKGNSGSGTGGRGAPGRLVVSWTSGIRWS